MMRDSRWVREEGRGASSTHESLSCSRVRSGEENGREGGVPSIFWGSGWAKDLFGYFLQGRMQKLSLSGFLERGGRGAGRGIAPQPAPGVSHAVPSGC